MTLDVNIKTVGATLGIITVVGGLFLGAFEFIASKKHEPIIKELTEVKIQTTEIKAQMEMLLEERMVVMERNSLWNRMQRTLGRSDIDNMSADRFSDKSDYFPNQSTKKK